MQCTPICRRPLPVLTLFAAALALAGCGDFWQSPSGTSTSTGTTASTVSLSASPTTAVEGTSVVLTATVSPSAATGMVTFFNGSTSIGTGTLTSGTATLTTTFGTVGTVSLTATYGGSSTYASSTSAAATVSVTASTTVDAASGMLRALTSTAKEGTHVTLTAAVTPQSAAGTITFYDSTTMVALGTETLSAGTATLRTQFDLAGMHRIVATYSGSGGDAASPTVSALSYSTTP
jgi:hypothetical protein